MAWFGYWVLRAWLEEETWRIFDTLRRSCLQVRTPSGQANRGYYRNLEPWLDATITWQQDLHCIGTVHIWVANVSKCILHGNAGLANQEH